MASILVLFNLKPGASVADYERWARERDLPTVRGLGSVSGFDVLRAQSLLMGEGKPPYQYAEIIDVKDMAAFGKDVSSDAVQKGAAEFQGFADNPIFVVCEKL
jgi:REDY-like protein HapK